MEKINGDANINVVNAAFKAGMAAFFARIFFIVKVSSQLPNTGVKNFAYVSTVENNLPSFLLKG